MVFMKKNNKKTAPFRNKRYHGCFEDFYGAIIFLIQAFEMQLSMFVRKCVEKIYVERLIRAQPRFC